MPVLPPPSDLGDGLPVTVLTGSSRALREQVLLAALRARPGHVGVAYDVETGGGTLQLVRTVLDPLGVHDREPVDLSACCLACAVRADVGPALRLLAGAERWQHVLLCLPAAVAAASVARQLAELGEHRVDAVVGVVDALLLQEHLSGGDLLADRGLAAAPTDRRSTADLLVAHLEEADVLAVAGLHRLSTAGARQAQALLAHLAPLALQVPLGPDGVGSAACVGTRRYDPACTPQAREQLAALAVELCPPSCGVTTLSWSSDAPLHPGLLSEALERLVGDVLRSRGEISLAGRPGQRVRWESAGQGLWFGDPVDVDGAPGCSLVLTGVDLDADALSAQLDACLASPDEEPVTDPFEDVLGPARPARTG